MATHRAGIEAITLPRAHPSERATRTQRGLGKSSTGASGRLRPGGSSVLDYRAEGAWVEKGFFGAHVDAAAARGLCRPGWSCQPSPAVTTVAACIRADAKFFRPNTGRPPGAPAPTGPQQPCLTTLWRRTQLRSDAPLRGLSGTEHYAIEDRSAYSAPGPWNIGVFIYGGSKSRPQLTHPAYRPVDK